MVYFDSHRALVRIALGTIGHHIALRRVLLGGGEAVVQQNMFPLVNGGEIGKLSHPHSQPPNPLNLERGLPLLIKLIKMISGG